MYLLNTHACTRFCIVLGLLPPIRKMYICQTCCNLGGKCVWVLSNDVVLLGILFFFLEVIFIQSVTTGLNFYTFLVIG